MRGKKMKKKIKVGDYIRDTDGDIGQCILAINGKYNVVYKNAISTIKDESYIIKSSKNIVDLLQIGDIITVSDVDEPLVIRSKDMIRIIKIRCKQ